MSKQKLTPWFPGSVEPARPGVYMRGLVNHLSPTFSLWTGERWMWSSMTVRGAASEKWKSSIQNAMWRGLASDPKAKK